MNDDRDEAAKLAKEYRNYVDKMPTDPYQRRWSIISRALVEYANSKPPVDAPPES